MKFHDFTEWFSPGIWLSILSKYAILNEVCLQADFVADDLARVEETHT
jgi:hypothetical protein